MNPVQLIADTTGSCFFLRWAWLHIFSQDKSCKAHISHYVPYSDTLDATYTGLWRHPVLKHWHTFLASKQFLFYLASFIFYSFCFVTDVGFQFESVGSRTLLAFFFILIRSGQRKSLQTDGHPAQWYRTGHIHTL